MTRKLADLVLAEFAEGVSRISEVALPVEAMETPQQMSALHGGKVNCVIATLTFKIAECPGTCRIVIPQTTLEPVQDKLSKMYFGDNLGGDVSWRDHILSNIKGSTVKVTARVHELEVPLVDILEWQPGKVIDLGIGEDQEIALMCSGIPVFHGYAGQRHGGRISLRIEREGADVSPAGEPVAPKPEPATQKTEETAE